MTATELAAYVGAAAWIPQVATWLYHWIARPKLSVIFGRSAELGFTSYGPIFNVNVAFSVERKPLIMNKLRMQLVHEDGDVRDFVWSGIQEDLGETRDASGLTQGRLQKDKVPIAIKISSDSLVERFVRFQEPRFRDNDLPLFKTLLAHSEHLKRVDQTTHVEMLLKSRELFALLDARDKAFWWKTGTYTVWVWPESSTTFSMAGPHRYTFVLEAWMVDELKRNLATIRTELENAIRSNLPDFEALPVNWRWMSPDILPVTKK